MKTILQLIFSVAIASAYAQNPLVSFDFVDTPLQVAVESVAKEAGQQVRVSPSVQGTITLSRQSISWQEAMQLFQTEFNLVTRRDGKTIWLEPAQQKDTKPTKKEDSKTAPPPYLLQSHKLKNYPVQKVLDLITDKKNPLFTNKVFAKIVADQNLLIVRADSASHAQIRSLIDIIDKSRPRIRIAGRIVVAKEQASNELGVRLGTRTINGNWGIAGGSQGVFTQTDSNSFLGLRDNLVLDLGLNQLPAGRIATGFYDGANIVELELQALQSNGKIDVVASPQVTVLSGAKAIIATGTEVPYSQVDDSKISIFFKEVLTKLEVTPHLVGERQIRLDIEIRLDNVGQFYSGVPSIDTNRLNTQVILDEGQTLILGGIFKTADTDTSRRVPILASIPVLGWLFRNQSVGKEKVELLIFITPSLVDG